MLQVLRFMLQASRFKFHATIRKFAVGAARKFEPIVLTGFFGSFPKRRMVAKKGGG
jgi:hypothetical protein